MHRDAKIIIKRKYIQGGGAMITPERAPARLVSVQEDVREVMLTRYGGDVECNLNHFLLPKEAQDEFEMKVNHQKRELERTLVNIGYETLMREGTMLPDAIVRSNPAITDAYQARSAAERITVRMLFGCCAKYSFPVQNILAACKYASAYSVSGRRGSVLILPHGLPELLRYTKPESMKYSVSGLTQSQTSKPIDMDLDNVVVDPTTGVRIMTHIPQPTFNVGAVLEPEPSPLQNKVTIRMMYDVVPGETQLLDFATGAMRTVSVEDIAKLLYTFDIDEELIERNGDGIRPEERAEIPLDVANRLAGAGQTIRLIRTVEFMMSSAILGVPGSGTGELLFAYPMTGISTNIAAESMLMKLRVYLGAALYQPEDILIIPDVAFEGIVAGTNWVNPATWGVVSQSDDADGVDMEYNVRNWGKSQTKMSLHKHPANEDIYADEEGDKFYQIRPVNSRCLANLSDDQDANADDNEKPVSTVYRGMSETAGTVVPNCGHLGELEAHAGWMKFWGNCGGNVYSHTPKP